MTAHAAAAAAQQCDVHAKQAPRTVRTVLPATCCATPSSRPPLSTTASTSSPSFLHPPPPPRKQAGGRGTGFSTERSAFRLGRGVPTD